MTAQINNVIAFPGVQPGEKAKKPAKRRNQYKDGRYCVRVKVQRPDGSKYDQPFYSRKSLSDAKAQRDAFKGLLKKGYSVEDACAVTKGEATEDDIAERIRQEEEGTPAEMTVARWAQMWVPLQQGKSKSNDDMYERYSKVIVEAIGRMPISQVRKMHLDPILKAAEDRSKSYNSKLHSVMKGLFADACESDLCDKDPSVRTKRPPGTYEGHRALEDWEINLILEHWRIRRAGWWMLLFMLSGSRRGEGIARKGKDYDPVNSEYSVTDAAHKEGNQFVNSGKTKTLAGVREAPVFGPLADAFSELSFQDEDYLLTSAKGLPLTESAFDRGWESMLLAIEKIANRWNPDKQKPRKTRKEDPTKDWVKVHWTPHDLRYTYATFLYDAGVDVKTAQVWLGHKDPRMTQDLYAQLSKRRKKRSTTAAKEYLEALRDVVSQQSASNSASDSPTDK